MGYPNLYSCGENVKGGRLEKRSSKIKDKIQKRKVKSITRKKKEEGLESVRLSKKIYEKREMKN